ncbi:uncharacterized protein LOC142329234 [Lycorma delicatula]|uniref:uncharacterized protein LOC142329234 n=1 Tax=Lycorma delicatula TaxID=130591 RepID=UPI003F5143C8
MSEDINSREVSLIDEKIGSFYLGFGGGSSTSLIKTPLTFDSFEPLAHEHSVCSVDLNKEVQTREFIHKKQRQRMQIVDLNRYRFDEYSNCTGNLIKEHYFPEIFRGVYCVRYAHDGKYLVVGYGSGAVNLYHTEDYTKIKNVVTGSEASYPITSICYLPSFTDHIFFVSTSEGFVLLYNQERDQLIRFIRQARNEINCVDVNHTCTNLITAGSKKDVRIYDLNTSMLISHYVRNSIGADSHLFNNYHKNRVFTVKFLLDDQNIFLSGGWDKTVRIWDLRLKAACVGTIQGPCISGEAVDARGNLILTGSWEPKNALNLWDIRTKSLISVITPYNPKHFHDEHYVLAAQFFNGDNENDVILVGSLGYKSVDVISLKLNLLLYSFFAEKSCMAVHSYENDITFGDMDTVLNNVNFNMNKEAQL